MRLAKVRTPAGPSVAVVGRESALLLPDGTALSDFLYAPDPKARVMAMTGTANVPIASLDLLAPVDGQEVWAAGVTYQRSKVAREEESAGAARFYDMVYTAPRPELFLKATPERIVHPGKPIRIRGDGKWNVPEPELALVISPHLKIVGYTIGNDVSSRDIEGENPLYLPQAKVYDGSCALGPGVYVTDDPLPSTTAISLRITRGGDVVFQGDTTLAQMRRKPQELVDYLYRETSYQTGCVLLTGTGIIPPDAFTLQSGDLVEITIEPIGTLVNVVE